MVIKLIFTGPIKVNCFGNYCIFKSKEKFDSKVNEVHIRNILKARAKKEKVEKEPDCMRLQIETQETGIPN